MKHKELHSVCLAKIHKAPKHVTDIYDFDKCVIWHTIHEFYVQGKMSATISKLLPKLKDRINFKGRSTSLRNLDFLRSLDFSGR
jgi:hypothetical protein